MSIVSHLLSMLLLSGPLQGPAATPRIIASSGDWTITAEEFEQIVKTFPPQDRQRFADPDNRRGLVDELVRIWVLTSEARRKGIDVGTGYESRRNYYQQYAREIGAAISEETVRNYYEGHLDDFTQIGLSHILILNGNSPITPYADVERLAYEEAEKKAKEIKAMLDMGADWDELSKKYSQDIAVKDHGGAVGYIPKGRAEKSIEDAVFSMKPGDISDVVGSVFGFHIFRVTDRKVKTFGEMRDVIRQRLTADELNRQLDAKVKESGVEIDESFFQ